MNWITGIQRALDYVEEHLMEELDYEAVAKQAYSSAFHFQRMFSMLCGFSLGEYIRMRRMTLAAAELCRTCDKVLDIALKYGYDTSESFSHAFTRFHGVTPSEARRGCNVKSFSRLSVKLILSGGNTMDYRIESKQAFKLVCKKKRVDKPQGDEATAEISAFWDECNQNGMMERLCRYAAFDNFGGILGVCFSEEQAELGFPYGIGAEYNGKHLEDDELCIVDIPAHTYAVFQCRGKLPDVFKNTYAQIYSEFFPQSEYDYGNGIELEVYPSEDFDNPNYACEIWIAVEKKNN